MKTPELTRRAFTQALSFTALAGLGATSSLTFATRVLAAAPGFEAYHNLTAASHQEKVAQLTQDGFRPISISVYGDAPNELYAAVWVKVPGPGFGTVHNVDSAGYQTAFNDWTGRGFIPTIVSATGSGPTERYAAVFEQLPLAFKARHGMTEEEFAGECNSATETQQILRWVTSYGSAEDRRYIAVWHANPAFAKGAYFTAPAEEFQYYSDVWSSVPQMRPACISSANDGSITAVFTDQGIGPYYASHNLDAAAFMSEFNRRAGEGFIPVMLQGGGAERFAAIFAKQEKPLARVFRVSGTAPPELASLDGLVEAFMKAQAVRAMQLTVAQNGVVKMQRAYNWAEPDYRDTQVSDLFLLASNSKMFVCAAIQSLYDSGKLQPSTKVYSLLGLSGPADPRSDTITIEQCLAHTAGYTYDPTYDMRTIALSRSLSGPCTMRDLANELYARTLDYPPGAAPDPQGWIYNNSGYVLGALVVEQVTGQPYFDYLREKILTPSSISEVAVYPTAQSPRAANFVQAEDYGISDSALTPTSDRLVPIVYGGDGMVKEAAVGSCGLAASATALTQFINRHAAWGMGGRTPSARKGSTPGTSSWSESRATGTDWALIINTRAWTPTSSDPDDVLIAAINAELDAKGL